MGNWIDFLTEGKTFDVITVKAAAKKARAYGNLSSHDRVLLRFTRGTGNKD